MSFRKTTDNYIPITYFACNIFANIDIFITFAKRNITP